jgi:predicted ATP-binding protein involved in virulence
MRLNNIILKNFRCFENLPVPLHPRLTVLVAENGEGKTTILDGIALALSRILTRIPGVSGKNIVLADIRINKINLKAPFTSIEAESVNGIKWSRSLKRDATTQTASEVDPRFGDKFLFEYLDPFIHAVNNGSPTTLPVIAYYGAHRAVLEIPKRRRNFKKEFNQFDGLRNAIEPSTHFKDLFEWFYSQEREHLDYISNVFLEQLNTEKRDPQGKVTIDPIALKKQLQNPAGRLINAIQVAIRKVVPGYSGPRIKTRPLRMVLTREISSAGKQELTLQQLSDGYRTMLAMVMDFARRLAQTNPHLENPLHAEAILLIDEVDLHLHPRWQQTVLLDLLNAFPNTQIITATHSPQVISTVPMDRIRIIKDGVLHSAPPATDGAEAQRILEDVFKVPARAKTETTAELDEYLRLVNDKQWDSQRALKLRKKLDNWSQGQEPRLLEADLQIENLKWEMKK